MLPSLHDYFLISYEVHCEARRITLRARPDTRPHPASDPSLDRIVVFDGVEGYHFWDDAFGNIIFSLTEVPVEKLLLDRQTEIKESYRMSGAPGPWAADLASADAVLSAKGIRGFELYSSYGLSGWLLAKQLEVRGGPQSAV
ncbi:hypothetical protein [Bradyrhizobium liaoningense]|uniref:hypothetical protein n=1 Tax=Bradyrhizobium liaoningense TaxID=43992 RepID=UPI001BA7E88C|nr:hypothetical protein [Bradyrhizobium liaoningense]MBR0711169.1 hypothetical protein [Bradyrhizobium liaoningense]